MSVNRSVVFLAGLVCLSAFSYGAAPTDNPVKAHFGEAEFKPMAWTDQIKWSQVVDVTTMPGETITQKLSAAQHQLRAKGGGVVYFPAGEYRFDDHVKLFDGIVIRGEAPQGQSDAREDDYKLGTRFIFPQYKPSFEGEGTPNNTAIKFIGLHEPATASNVGVVNIAIDFAHVYFSQGAKNAVGKNRLIFGCILKNTASVASDVPRKEIPQPGYVRWTNRHRAAMHAYSAENLLIANNRAPKSGQANWEMPNYVLAKKQSAGIHDLSFNPARHEFTKVIVEKGVFFDFDNRPGIYANDFTIGAHGDGMPNGTPDSHPHGFRKGTVIRNNYIFATGRCPIAFSGDGVKVIGNVIRIPDGVWRPTCRGFETSGAGSTNDNRGIQCRGYRWEVIDNDIEVFSNISWSKRYKIGDGEGIMHENHANSKILHSKIIGNKMNAGVIVWRLEVDGLEVRGNKINMPWRHAPGIASSIYILGKKRHWGDKSYTPVRNLKVIDNDVAGAGITVLGKDGEGNVVKDNRATGPWVALIIENLQVISENNTGFKLFDTIAAANKARAAWAKSKKD